MISIREARMDKGWTFGRKLAFGFALVVGVMLVMAVVIDYGLEAVRDVKEQVIVRTRESLLRAKDLEISLARRVATARAYLLTAKPELLEAALAETRAFSVTLGELEERIGGGERGSVLARVRELDQAHATVLRTLMERRRVESDLAAIADAFDETSLPRYEELRDGLRRFSNQEADANEAGQAEAERVVGRTRSAVLGATLIGLLVAVAVGVHLTRLLGRQVGSTVENLRSASTELQTAATQQATSSREQVSAVQETLTTMKELLVTSRQIGESAAHVAEVARGALAATRQGDALATAGRQGNADVRAQIDHVVSQMVELGKKSRQIGTVLALVNELAEQTNILAVNATIEATAAGEAGVRFGAVADEIRGLADRVTSSTRDIQGLIDEVRASVNATVMATETGSKAVEAGARQFDEFAGSFSRIAEMVANTADAAREIELSTSQQQTAVEQVNVAVGDVSQAAQETATSAKQTQSTATQLVSLAAELQSLIQEPSGS